LGGNLLGNLLGDPALFTATNPQARADAVAPVTTGRRASVTLCLKRAQSILRSPTLIEPGRPGLRSRVTLTPIFFCPKAAGHPSLSQNSFTVLLSANPTNAWLPPHEQMRVDRELPGMSPLWGEVHSRATATLDGFSSAQISRQDAIREAAAHDSESLRSWPRRLLFDRRRCLPFRKVAADEVTASSRCPLWCGVSSANTSSG